MGAYKSVATHAHLYNTLSSNKYCPKIVKILTVKMLKKIEKSRSSYISAQYDQWDTSNILVTKHILLSSAFDHKKKKKKI